MSKPHILFILADQMRSDALGSATPNINALAARGVKFAQCYSAAPLCQPARNSIITGKFSTYHGVCGNQNTPISMQERRDTFAQHLRAEGYYTAYIGKHHYIDRFNLGVDITDDDEEIKGYGYDHVWQVGDVVEGLYNEDRYTKYLAEKEMLEAYRQALKSDGKAYVEQLLPSETKDGYIGEQAVEYIRNYSGDSSLFLCVGFLGPHGPYWVPKEFSSKFDPEGMTPPKGVSHNVKTERVKREKVNYLGKVLLIDRYVGKLCAVLEEKNMLENTLIVFTSDHGVALGDYGIWGKRYFYDVSVKVPLVISGPGVYKDKQLGIPLVCKALVSQVDLYPTFLAVAGCENILGITKIEREGMNLLDFVTGAQSRKEVYSELGTAMMIRTANWKLVWDAEQDGIQYLFNLRRDSDELDNLAGIPEYDKIAAELAGRLLSRLIKMTHSTHFKEQINLQRVRV